MSCRRSETLWDAPAILLGRGGSGTRLLSQLATGSGLFLGNSLNYQGDSLEWVELIYRMVRETRGGANESTVADYRTELRENARRVLTTRSDLVGWGLKLPETMVVLPALLAAFPRAKIVHLVRHPVSSSLRRTHMASRLDNEVGKAVLPAAYAAVGRSLDLLRTDDSWIHNALTWRYQVEKVLGELSYLEADRQLQLKYEEICADPETPLSRLQRHLGLDPRPLPPGFKIDADRTGTWEPDDPRAPIVWSFCGEIAARLGYSADIVT